MAPSYISARVWDGAVGGDLRLALIVDKKKDTEDKLLINQDSWSLSQSTSSYTSVYKQKKHTG